MTLAFSMVGQRQPRTIIWPHISNATYQRNPEVIQASGSGEDFENLIEMVLLSIQYICCFG